MLFSLIAHILTTSSNFDRQEGRKRRFQRHFHRWHGDCERQDTAIRGIHQLIGGQPHEKNKTRFSQSAYPSF